MKIEIDHSVLADAAAWAARALAQRPAHPVLAGIKLDAADDRLTVSAFDYETATTSTVNADVADSGTVVVPGKLLAEITRSVPAKPVTITTESTRATLACGAATFTLPLLPAEDYPALPAMPPVVGAIGSEAFAELAGQVTAAAAKDDTLPALTAVHVMAGADGTLTMVCTDRYRLAIRDVAWEPSLIEGVTALIPAKALAGAAKAMTGGDVVTVSLDGGMAGLSGGGKTLVTRLMGGEFPPYLNLIPAAFAATAQVAGEPLTDAVKRVALCADRNTPVGLTFTGSEVVLEAGTGEEAQAVEVLDARYEFTGLPDSGVPGTPQDEAFTADGLRVAFNPHYLLDGLAVIGAETVTMGFTKPGKAVQFTGKPGPDGGADFRYLLMPVRQGG